jgi:transposase
MPYYLGIDLHSTNCVLGLVDQKGGRVFHRKVPNELAVVMETLRPYKRRLREIAVEATYNWYWLVDGLREAGYTVRLGHPAAFKKYEGLKYADDVHDAFWLAEMLRLGILPTAYIYPKEQRMVRDLLRKRAFLVHQRGALQVNLQHTLVNHGQKRLKSCQMQAVRTDHVTERLNSHEALALSAQVSKECIDFLTLRIKHIERRVEQWLTLETPYRTLLTLPGVGKILAMTLMLETGPISRFPKVGNYASYCRKVSSKWLSNAKVKERGNVKNGNPYLAWAYAEAAELARRYDPAVRAYYQRKTVRKHRMVAHFAVAHKLARAAYFMLRDQVPYDGNRLFG